MFSPKWNKGVGTSECREFSSKIIDGKHRNIRFCLRERYKRIARDVGYVRANCALRKMNDQFSLVDRSYIYRGYAYVGASWSAAMSDEDIALLAGARASACEKFITEASKALEDAVDVLEGFFFAQDIVYPLVITSNDTQESIIKKREASFKRVTDVAWWRRQLRKKCARQVEGGLREHGFTKKQKAPYVSNYTFERWKARQKKNALMLAGFEAVTDDGDVVNLLEAKKKSVSNPDVMNTELAVRMKGYSEIGKALGLQCLFLTLTCPSKYHAQGSRGGANGKFEGATPRDAMEYLNCVWAKIRAEWKRMGIKTFGFRVSEPHHDGTPHCHFSLFFSPYDAPLAMAVFRKYALEQDGDEDGAQEHRCDVVVMDESKGSAVGYMMKYIAKNLNGYSVDVDFEGQVSGYDGALRVKAWASTWGIRQFQQIGSVSVTVWRELRRHRDILTDAPEKLEELRSAADRGDWMEFVELMGGVFVGRNDQTARPQYLEHEESSSFGDDVAKLVGVWLQPIARRLGFFLNTREKVWEIRAARKRVNKVAAQPPPLDLCQ